MDTFRSGAVEGTGAAINIELGWVPDYVEVMNIDDAGNLFAILKWTSDMPDGHAMKFLSIADNGSTGRDSHDKITTNGISAYAGTEGGNRAGFTIGADTDVNVAAETIVWTASRNGLGGQ